MSFSDLDRSNIGNARLQGLPEDVLDGDKTGVLFDWVVSAFFFSYVGITHYARRFKFINFFNRFSSKSQQRSYPNFSNLRSMLLSPLLGGV